MKNLTSFKDILKSYISTNKYYISCSNKMIYHDIIASLYKKKRFLGYKS